MRYSLRTLLILAALVPPALWLLWSPSAVPTKDLPPNWSLAEIADAAPPRSDDGATHVLAWKIVEDSRPWRVESCLVLKQLNEPTEKQERWALASLARVPAAENEWQFVILMISPNHNFTNPPLIMHVEKYRERPTNADIYAFMDRCDWRLGPDSDGMLMDGCVCRSQLIDGGICRAWQKVIHQKPQRAFFPSRRGRHTLSSGRAFPDSPHPQARRADTRAAIACHSACRPSGPPIGCCRSRSPTLLPTGPPGLNRLHSSPPRQWKPEAPAKATIAVTRSGDLATSSAADTYCRGSGSHNENSPGQVFFAGQRTGCEMT